MLYSTCNLEAPIMGSMVLFVFRRMESGHSGDHPVVWVLTYGYQSPFRVRECPLGAFIYSSNVGSECSLYWSDKLYRTVTHIHFNTIEDVCRQTFILKYIKALWYSEIRATWTFQNYYKKRNSKMLLNFN